MNKNQFDVILNNRIKQEQLLLDPQKCTIDDQKRILEAKLYVNISIDLAIEQVKTNEIGGKHYACKKGCSFCCHDRIDANIMDAFAAYEYFTFCNSIAEDDRKKIEDRISNYPKLFHDKSVIRYEMNTISYSDMLPCPFLINDSCAIYLARPAACRGCNRYGNPELCKTPGAEGNASPLIMEKASMLINYDIEFQKSFSYNSKFSSEPIPLKLDEAPFWGVFAILLNIVWNMDILSIKDAKIRYRNMIKEFGIDNGEIPGENKAKTDRIIQLVEAEQVETNTSATFQNVKRIGRNEPCPCGSGKKYKKCCGSNVN